jgi:hypothetical protein
MHQFTRASRAEHGSLPLARPSAFPTDVERLGILFSASRAAPGAASRAVHLFNPFVLLIQLSQVLTILRIVFLISFERPAGYKLLIRSGSFQHREPRSPQEVHGGVRSAAGEKEDQFRIVIKGRQVASSCDGGHYRGGIKYKPQCV